PDRGRSGRGIVSHRHHPARVAAPGADPKAGHPPSTTHGTQRTSEKEATSIAPSEGSAGRYDRTHRSSAGDGTDSASRDPGRHRVNATAGPIRNKGRPGGLPYSTARTFLVRHSDWQLAAHRPGYESTRRIPARIHRTASRRELRHAAWPVSGSISS